MPSLLDLIQSDPTYRAPPGGIPGLLPRAIPSMIGGDPNASLPLASDSVRGQSILALLADPEFWDKVNRTGGEAITNIAEWPFRTAANVVDAFGNAARGHPGLHGSEDFQRAISVGPQVMALSYGLRGGIPEDTVGMAGGRLPKGPKEPKGPTEPPPPPGEDIFTTPEAAKGRNYYAGAENASDVTPTPDIPAQPVPPVRATKIPGQIAGAPRGFTAAAQEAAARRKYLGLMGEAAPYRQWYSKAGQSILDLMGGDVDAATRLAGYLSVTSADTGVDPNTGYGIRANNQVAVGDPIETGKFPDEMSATSQRVAEAQNAADVYTQLGLKRGPYAQNMAAGGGFGLPGVRSVNDIWQGRALGYSERELKSGLKSAQHNWIDAQMGRIIDAANAKSVGDIGNWDVLTAQAAAWIAKRARDKGMTIEEAAKDYSDFWKKYYGQGSYEAVPGASTTHLPGLRTADLAERAAHFNDVYSVLSDSKNRDLLSLAFGAPTGPSVRGPGYFEGSINPGAQTQVALARAANNPNAIDPSSAKLMNAIEGTRGILLGQNAFAWHLAGNVSSKPQAGMVDFSLPGGPISNQAMLDVLDRMQKYLGADKRVGPNVFDNITPVPTADGFRLVFHGQGDPISRDNRIAVSDAANKVAADMNAESVTFRRNLASELHSNDWSKFPQGQQYLQFLDSPKLQTSFNSIAPRLARDLNETEAGLEKQFGGPAASEVRRVREIIEKEGFDGLRRAAKSGALTVGAVGIALGLAAKMIGGMGTNAAGQPEKFT